MWISTINQVHIPVSEVPLLHFCVEGICQPLPLTEETLSIFTVFLARQGLKYQSVKGYLSALRHLQIAEGLGDPFLPGAFSRLEYILKGVKHTPSAQLTLAPYYPGHPEVMVEASTQSRYSDAVDSMLSGMFGFSVLWKIYNHIDS